MKIDVAKSVVFTQMITSGGMNMNCPICGSVLRKGFILVDSGEMSNAQTTVTWYPDEEKGKEIKNGAVELGLESEGMYCDECMKVFATFDVHFNSMF